MINTFVQSTKQRNISISNCLTTIALHPCIPLEAFLFYVFLILETFATTCCMLMYFVNSSKFNMTVLSSYIVDLRFQFHRWLIQLIRPSFACDLRHRSLYTHCGWSFGVHWTWCWGRPGSLLRFSAAIDMNRLHLVRPSSIKMDLGAAASFSTPSWEQLATTSRYLKSNSCCDQPSSTLVLHNRSVPRRHPTHSTSFS